MIDFLLYNDELIMLYTPYYGIEEILKNIKTSDGHNIKNTFWVEESLLRKVEDYDEEFLCVAIGKVGEHYISINPEVVGTKHTFFFANDIKLNQKMFVAYRNISILGKIDIVIERDFYIGGEQSEIDGISENVFKELINSFPNTFELTKYAHKRIAVILKEFFPECDKYEAIYEKYIEKKRLPQNMNSETSSNVNKKIKLEQFTLALIELEEMLDNAEYTNESIWQVCIQNILQLLYPQYILCARELTFHGIDGYDKRPDFILVDANGFIDVMEIKKPSIDVLTKQATYRNNYVPVREFSGAIQQIEKYIFCLNTLDREKNYFLNNLSNMLPQGVIPQVVNPQGILLLGRSNNFNEQQKRDFELIKRQYKNVADIMTYDDLIFRFKTIIESLK